MRCFINVGIFYDTDVSTSVVFLIRLVLISYLMLQKGGERSCLTTKLCSKLRKGGVETDTAA